MPSRLPTTLAVMVAVLLLLAPVNPCRANDNSTPTLALLRKRMLPSTSKRTLTKLLADGTPCNMLNTCQNCQNPATPWFDGLLLSEEYRCGTQQAQEELADGVVCIPGSTCQNCENGYVHNKVFNEYRCGQP